MKPNQIILAAAFLGSIFTASAQLTIPSDGSDGALNITADTVIDLSKAVTGTWDQNNTANAGKGVYDPDKWAIVFKYTSVNIAGQTTGTPSVLIGRKVTFINHPSRAPVVWLVQGNVTIDGILDLKGKIAANDSVSSLVPTEPGPGGFRGGPFGPSGAGGGLGPGGGGGGSGNGTYAMTYGNPQIIPLIGGSGADAIWSQRASSGGGGAILIQCANALVVNGLITADGGDHIDQRSWGAAGGAVKLVANSVSGVGTVRAMGSQTPSVQVGRIRIETSLPLSPSLLTFPETIGVPPASPPVLWPAANAPKARIVSVDAIAAPTDPRSPLVAAADIAIQNNAPVNIVIETRDFPIEGVVQLSIIPKFAFRSRVNATRISGNINLATWRVTTTLPQGFVTLQARATQP